LSSTNQFGARENCSKSEIFADKAQEPNSEHSRQKYKIFSFVTLTLMPLSGSRNNRMIGAGPDDLKREEGTPKNPTLSQL
jgi:hypothetical protein